MTSNSNEAFVMTEMKQQLKYPRTYRPNVASIPDDQVNCQQFKDISIHV